MRNLSQSNHRFSRFYLNFGIKDLVYIVIIFGLVFFMEFRSLNNCEKKILSPTSTSPSPSNSTSISNIFATLTSPLNNNIPKYNNYKNDDTNFFLSDERRSDLILNHLVYGERTNIRACQRFYGQCHDPAPYLYLPRQGKIKFLWDVLSDEDKRKFSGRKIMFDLGGNSLKTTKWFHTYPEYHTFHKRYVSSNHNNNNNNNNK